MKEEPRENIPSAAIAGAPGAALRIPAIQWGRRRADLLFGMIFLGVLGWGVWYFPCGQWIINADQPMHFMQMWGTTVPGGLWNLPWSWNPWVNCGRPTFHSYNFIPSCLIFPVRVFLSHERSYNLILLIGWLACPTAAYFYFRRQGEAWAGILAFLFLFLQPGDWLAGGFGQAVLTGMYSQAAGQGILLLTVYRLERYRLGPNPRRFFLLSIACGVLLLAHVNEMSLFGAILIAYVVRPGLGWRRRLSLALLLPVLTLFWAGPVWIGLIASQIGGYWLDPMRALKASSPDFVWDVFHKTFFENLGPLFLGSTLPALAYCVYRRPGAWRLLENILIACVALILMNHFLFPVYRITPWAKMLQINKLFGDIRVVLLCGLALAIVDIAKRWLADPLHRWGFVVTAVGMLLLLFGHALSLDMGDVMRLDAKNRIFYEKLWAPLKGKQGRLLPQQMLGRTMSPEGRTHMDNAAPLFTGEEVLTFDGMGMSRIEHGAWAFEELYAKHVKNAPDRGRAWCQRYDIKYLCLLRQNESIFPFAKPIHYWGDWVILETDITPARVEVGGGRVIGLDMKPSGGRAEIEAEQEASVLIKISDYPNWRVSVDSQKVRKSNAPGDLIEVRVPAGKHVIEWRYQATWAEYIGYGMLLFNLAAAFFVLRRPKQWRAGGAI